MDDDKRKEMERKKMQKRLREQRRRQQVMRQRIVLGAVAVLLVIIVAGAATVNARKKKEKEAEEARIAREKEEEEQAAKEEKNNTIRIMAAGDNILDQDLIDAGKGEGDTWNYDFLYEKIKEDIQTADLALVSQETPLVNDHKEVSGTGLMASPLEAGHALAAAGFDIVMQATDHAFDKGKVGILNTCTFWETEHPEITYAGIHAREEDAENRVKIVEKKNFKLAFLNYTYGISDEAGFTEDDAYFADVYAEDMVKEDIQNAKSQADMVIVYLHGGAEYSTEPTEEAQKRIDFMAQQGVDILFCSNPHVLQKYGMMSRSDGGQMLLYNSLGNLVSADTQIPALTGGIADITLHKNAESGEVEITDYSLLPTVMHYDSEKKSCAVYWLSDYTEELAKAHGIHQITDETFTLESIKEAVSPYENPETMGKSEEEDSDTSDTGESEEEKETSGDDE